jgi:hypothetical protein
MQPEADHAEISDLFEAFLPEDLASRFTALLGMKQERWKKIDPWRVWEHIEAGSSSEWPGTAQGLLTSPKFANYAESRVVALRCGHDRPLIERRTLRSALVGQDAVFEGFISVLPGKLGVAINHDGEICVLSK